MRIFSTLVAAVVATQAQAFTPTRPIEVVVHTGPGGGSDLLARAAVLMIEKDGALAVAQVGRARAVLPKQGHACQTGRDVVEFELQRGIRGVYLIEEYANLGRSQSGLIWTVMHDVPHTDQRSVAPDGRSYAVAVMIKLTSVPLPVRMLLMNQVVRAVIAQHDMQYASVAQQ